MNTLTIHEARDKFVTLVRNVTDSEEPVVIERADGKKAVLLAYADWYSLISELRRANDQLEKCLLAAEGAECQMTAETAPGWSTAYQMTTELRDRYEKLRSDYDALRREADSASRYASGRPHV